MAPEDILGLLGGLALFLYGMQMMSDGLEDAAGDRMKSILEKLTSNRILGVAVGAGITAVIQSSSATTVMVVGFVNSGIMTLKQAVWIIMGANIGTTITGILISLDVGMFAPLFAFVGVAFIVFFKNPKLHHIGKILAGLGVLFIGMDMMSGSMSDLRENEAFISIMTTFSNPVLGILAGMVFTAIIQSSSASVGILQTLAGSGLIPFSSAVFVLFGQNIGTCITAVLASIGTNRAAKRTTIIHLMFNIIGTTIFTLICVLFPFADFIGGFAEGNPEAQIATMHTLFNISTTIILLPFGTYLAKFATKILPDKAEDMSGRSPLLALKEDFSIGGRTTLGYIAVHTDLLRQEITRMVTLAGENVERCYQAVLDTDSAMVSKVEEVEETIDGLNRDISQYISKVLSHSPSGQSAQAIEQYFLITGNAERIGDHASNISGYVDTIKRKSITFSEQARGELSEMQHIAGKAIRKVFARETDTAEWLSEVAALEQQMDDMTRNYRESHLERMRTGLCSEEACILFSELLTDFERIGDHVLNIAQAYAKIDAGM